MNVPFSHPSDLYPQKDGRKVRSCDELPLTLGLPARPDLALGGSTNATLHLLAIAHAANMKLTEDLSEVHT